MSETSKQQYSSPPTGGETTKPDPFQTLAELRRQMAQEETELSQHTRNRDSLKADVSELEKSSNEIQQSLAAYTQAWPKIQKDKPELTAYFNTKKTMIEAAIGNNKKEIDQKIAKFDNDVAAKEKEVPDLEKQKNETATRYEQAQTGLRKIQESFNFWKNFAATLTRKIKDATELRTQIEKQDEQNHPASMYFLITELEKTLKDADVISQEDLRAKLNQAWGDLNAAKGDVRTKKAAWEDAKSKLETAQTALADLRQQRKDKILESISQYNSPSTQQSAGTPKESA